MKADESLRTVDLHATVVDVFEVLPAPNAPRPGRSRTTSRIALYLGTLTFASCFGDPSSFLNIPLLFLLKDRLQLGPQSVALFETITLIPHYLAFFAGVLRDRWRRFGVGDRVYLLIAAPAAAGIYVWVAAGSQDYFKLLIGMVTAMVAFQFLDTAGLAMAITVGQRQAITGRLSALTALLEGVGGMGAAIVGGWMASRSSFQTVLFVAAGASLIIFFLGFWKPVSVFPPTAPIPRERGWLNRLLLHRPLVLTSGIFLLYNVAPGAGTPLFYFLTDHVQMSALTFGVFRSVLFAGSALATVGYGLFCTRYSLARLLRWAIIANSCAVLMFLWIGTPFEGVALGAAIGLVGGFGQVALMDLLMRACPEGLEGTASMLCLSLFGVAGSVGDLAGAWLYEWGGFGICVAADAVVALLILPLVSRLPGALIAAEGPGRAEERP